jgi:PAS domain S-box-containing protein
MPPPSDGTSPQATKALLAKQHELILQCAGEGIYGLDLNGVTTFVNPRAAELLGWEPDELIGKPQHAVSHHSRADGSPYAREECPIYAAFKVGRVQRVADEVFWRKDGTSFPVEYVSTPIRDAAGELIGAVVTFRDITKRVEAEEAVRRLQRLNASILDSAGEGIYGLDCQGNTTFVNPAAAMMLGWEPGELLDQPQHRIIHHSPPDGTPYPAAECPIYAAFSDGAVHRVDDEVFWRKDGTSLPVEYVSTPIRDEEGNLSGAVVSFIDITERKRQQEALERALAEVQELKDRLYQENLYLQQEIQVNHNFEEIIGTSDALKKTLSRLEQVAGTDATVLVTGETGVGKELFARAIHHLSPRSERPLVKVNCAALPSTLIESELFGHEKGAFTGATSQRIGRFELAHGGTIFLDEIGELPLELQAKLLRVLQEGELERIGGSRTLAVDVRVIAATNRDLTKAVWTGGFRDDLYYRLNVFPVEIAPLRERKKDIPQLVMHFVRKHAAKLGKEITHIPDHTQAALQRYDWPGNIRELENVIERGVILSGDGTLRVDEALEMHSPEPISAPNRRALAAVERDHILGVLEQTNWRIEGNGGAAVILGLHPNTLRSRMKKAGIEKRVGPAH